ncbi:unnamed protein product [Tuber melanosporum]|uniref:(Perigord truffle) hypothetical protein n=1 Tax=Tuber melanosporum (strain Mel28) TaxID=656061 RepID=D5G6N7_TUBMM|nr:uncharacterized protein GSTUM_00002144001 [Tuber melanosporum]CAZ80180.1 unnamed protein product [Tuber melanosporum]
MFERGNGSKSAGTSAHVPVPVVDGSPPPPTRTYFMATPPLAPLVGGFEDSRVLNTPRQQKGFFSLFSRFGGKSKSLSNIITKPEAFTKPVESSRPSVPSTPVTPSMKRSLSIPVFNTCATSDHSPSSPSRKSWEPVPLSEAFTQAIRMASLSASSLSMETLIRRNSERGKNPKDRRGRILHRSHASTRSVDLDWTRKTFVLIEGFLLQYAGDGPHDRSPEKTLQLTSTSIAFASDVIPGRPWVLQVYRSAGPDGSLLPERKGSFLSKIAFKGPAKNTAVSLLLVFDGAEEMDAWMGCIRAEASRLGEGNVNKPVSEVVSGIREEEEGEEQDDPRHSRRFVIDRAVGSVGGGTVSDENTSKRASTYYRSSLDAGRSFTTTVSGDHILLEHLRGSRLSSLSSTCGARVPTVSPDTSPERSSTRNKRSSVALSARSRSSMDLKPPSQRPLSVMDRDGNLYWIPRTPSPSAPNFSLPIPLSNGHPQLGSRRSTFSAIPPGAISPMPTPPISTRPSLSAVSTVGVLSEISYPRTRPRQSQSNPPSPSVIVSPKAKSTPIPARPQRPVSMFDSRSPPPSEVQNLSKSPSIKKHHLQAGIAVPPRTKSLRRKSMTAIGPSGTGAAGPPLHPPPSIPLPRLPPSEDDSNSVYTSSMPSPHHRKLPPPPGPSPPKTCSLGNRHSFHGVRREKYV